jgi:PHD/YefM family antitoxin component YafN of YafNO toxin-antitoxin module
MKLRAPEIILRNGKPSAVILDINAYENLLEQLEQKEDLKALVAARKTKLRFRSLDAFLAERHAHV